MDALKILCVIDSLGSGGAQRQMVGLAKSFKEKGHDVTILVYHEDIFFKNSLEQVQIPLVVILEPNYLKRLLKIRNHIRKGYYNAVLAFQEAPSFICEIAGLPTRKWKLLVGERNADPNILKSFKLKAYRWFHMLADFVIANSHENIKIVRKINPFLSSGTCKVIYNIFDFNLWKPLNTNSFRKDGKLNLLFAARHEPQKNLLGVIEAVNLLSETSKNALYIHWYGNKITPPFKDKHFPEAMLKIRNYNLESIFNFYPSSPDIIHKMQEADAVGLFSLHEGFPNTICEAMACGKPVVATNVSDNKFIIDHGISGFLAVDSTPETICDTIQQLLNCTNEELLIMGNNARRKITELLNRDDLVNEYLKLMQN